MSANFRRFDPYAPVERAQSLAPAPHPMSILNTRQGAQMLASVLIHKLGGRVVLTQGDFHQVAWTRLMESNERDETGTTLDGQALALWIEHPAPTTGRMQ